MSKAVSPGPVHSRVSDTAVDGVIVTASDTDADPNGPFYALYVGTAGNITITTLAGNTLLLTAVPLGILKIGCSRVWSTGTASAGTIAGLK